MVQILVENIFLWYLKQFPQLLYLDFKGRSSARSGRGDGEGHDVDVGLTIKLQQKLNKTQQLKEKLEKRVEELEATLTKYKTQQVNIADTLKVSFKFWLK